MYFYHTTGRISEESSEAYNGTLAEIKWVVRNMPTDKKRVEKTVERVQGT